MFDIQEKNNRLQITISSEMKLVDKIIDYLESTTQGLEQTQSFALKLIAKELICNAITHGNQSQADKLVTFTLTTLSNRLFVQVEDQGEGINVDKIDWKISNDASNPRNRGLAMVNHYADSIDFNQKGNQVSTWIKITNKTQFELKKLGDLVTLKILGNLGVNEITELESQLAQSASFGIHIQIDMSSVCEIDSMAIGALLSFGYNLKSQNKNQKIEFINVQKEIEILLNFVHANKFYDYLPSN